MNKKLKKTWRKHKLNIFIIIGSITVMAYIAKNLTPDHRNATTTVLSTPTNTTNTTYTKYFGVNIAGPEFEKPIYTQDNYQTYRYLNNKSLTLVRLPFKWEKLQPTPLENLDNSELNNYTNMVTQAQNANEEIIIEPHNYARYNNSPLTTKDKKSFTDLWTKISQKFSNGYDGVWGYELMNEPHDIPGGCQTWKELSQSAIDAIRQQDTKHYILVPGYSWQSAADWPDQSSCLANLNDPNGKLIYAAHEYFDEDKSGTYKSTCTDPTIGAKRAQPFLNWLTQNGKKGIFTEYGTPPDNCWLTTLDNFLQQIYNNPDIIGGIYWAAGPAWGDYPLSIEPKNNQDQPQTKILEKYPTK